MLVLSRRLHEKIVFPSINAKVQIVAIKSGVVRLGIEAPPEVPVLREELPDRNKEWGTPAATKATENARERIDQLVRNRLKINDIGLTLLRRQIEAGQTNEAQTTLTKIQEDLQLLQDRLAAEVKRSAPRPATKPCRTRKALLVEDDHNECELLAGFLRLAGLDVTTASDGADALNYLQHEGRPDVMLLDMVLPRCDGPTTVRQIRNNPAYAGLKIYGVTGHSPERFRKAMGNNTVDAWYQKPVNPEALLKDLCAELPTVAV